MATTPTLTIRLDTGETPEEFGRAIAREVRQSVDAELAGLPPAEYPPPAYFDGVLAGVMHTIASLDARGAFREVK